MAFGGLIQDVLGTVGIGKTQAQESADRAAELQAQALARLDQIGIPSIEAQRIVLESPELVGLLVPELEGFAEQMRGTALEQVQVDPALKQKQLMALAGLEERVNMGLTPQDEADLNQMARQARGEAQARDAAILQNMQQRGMGGAGAELASRLMSNQAQTQALAQEQQQKAADAFNLRMAALGQLGSQAGQARSQEYGEQTDLARARDAIAQANLQLRADQRQRDIERQNLAQQANLANQQAIANQKIANKNQQEMFNKGLIQQDFENRFRKATGAAGQLSNMSQTAMNTAANQQAAFGGLLNTAGGLGVAKIMQKPQTTPER